MTGLIGIIILTGACFRSMHIHWKQYQPNTPPKPIKGQEQPKTGEIDEIQDENDTNKIHSIEWDAASREVIDIKLN